MCIKTKYDISTRLKQDLLYIFNNEGKLNGELFQHYQMHSIDYLITDDPPCTCKPTVLLLLEITSIACTLLPGL